MSFGKNVNKQIFYCVKTCVSETLIIFFKFLLQNVTLYWLNLLQPTCIFYNYFQTQSLTIQKSWFWYKPNNNIISTQKGRSGVENINWSIIFCNTERFVTILKFWWNNRLQSFNVKRNNLQARIFDATLVDIRGN